MKFSLTYTLYLFLNNTRTHTFSLSITSTHTLSLTHTLSPSTLSPTHTHPSGFLYISHTYIHNQISHSATHIVPFSLTHAHAQTVSLFITSTHTHSLFRPSRFHLHSLTLSFYRSVSLLLFVWHSIFFLSSNFFFSLSWLSIFISHPTSFSIKIYAACLLEFCYYPAV
jgi:hypothetical protein